MQDAQRVLHAITNLADRSKHTFATSGAQKRIAPGFSPPSAGVPYHERTRNLGRSHVVLAKGSAKQDPIPVDAEKSLVKSILSQEPIAKLDLDTTIWKGSDLNYTTRLGFVHGKAHGTLKPFTLGSSNALFAPGLSHYSPLLSYLSRPLREGKMQNYISFIYRHDVAITHAMRAQSKLLKQKLDSLNDKLPEVRFTFEIKPGKLGLDEEPIPPEFKSASIAWIDSHYSVALPDSAIDFSVNETYSPTLDYGPLKHESLMDKTFTPLIDEMKASIEGKGRLRARPTIQVPIPKSWIKKQHASQLPGYDAKFQIREHNRVPYRFVGVEHRQNLPFQRGTQEYTFSTVEGGKLGARYAELSVKDSLNLHSLPEQDVTAKREEKLLAAFKIGFELVDLVDRAAKGQLAYKDVKAQAVDLEEMTKVAEPKDASTVTNAGASNVEATYAGIDSEDAAPESDAPAQEEGEGHEEECRAAASG